MADIQKLNVNNTTYDISTTWEKVTGKPSTFTPSSHTHSYLPLSGGTIEAYNAFPLTIKVSTASNLLTFITDNNTERTVVGYYASSTRGSEFRNTTSGSYIGITDKGTPHYNGNTLIHSGNYNSYAPTLTGGGASGTWGIDISGNAATATNATTATNADKLDGYHIASYGHLNDAIPVIGRDGVMEIGAYLDMHHDNTNVNYDYSVRVYCPSVSNVDLVLPSAPGNLALLTDNVTSATKLQTPRTLWGQSFDGSGNVSGNITSSYFHIVDRASNPYFKLVDSDGQIGYVQLLPSNQGVAIGSTSTKSLTVNPSGNVLIGTNIDNGYKLQVNGSANATTLYENGTRVALSGHTHSYLPLSGGTVSGTITATGFYQSSDERLKTFYDPIKIDFDKLSKLRKNYFKFNDKDKLEIGVSAQEVQSIYPEIVSENSDGYLSVAYDKLSVIALAAIDELDDKILQLANKISTLENIINKLMGEKGAN